MNQGKVYLIGAGPGDPGLLTCRAKQLLSECDVVCYDKLVSAAILAIVPESVALHEVGYLGYQGTHIDYGMHPEVLDFALAGKRVARLKAGDPCIFGRTTEECRDLNQLGIAYEIVPGITAALGAASYSGFPLTSAGVASSVTFVSGHRNTHALEDWVSNGNKSGTLVLYMGAKKLAEHTQYMMDSGVSPDLPIAVISSATSANHQCIAGTVNTIAGIVEQRGYIGPALVIAGEVVTQANDFDWRKHLPLSGSKVLVCGDYEHLTALRDLGAEVISISPSHVQSSIDLNTLNELTKEAALNFYDLAAFKAWWHALDRHNFDVRRFMMPLGSADPMVKDAMRNVGIQSEPLNDNAKILTARADFSANHDSASGKHDVAGGKRDMLVIGEYSASLPRFTLPDIAWVLVSNTALFDTVKQQQPTALQHTQFVALNQDVQTWAMRNNINDLNTSSPWFLQGELVGSLEKGAYVD
ncbi:uroporphyrinogen-III C-methyltransferase [Thaumasiovibrio sp. DFM-14]|uniref:uroporphyrinogen-III C-methyltransferase n=1 Tax=Thaumasiovibrio sp. DFM-14 TaxID=3384792 RepID=UPI0039A36E5D